ncbi:hypothetical protein [Chitinophaga pinensis]|uniref:hypothetical protein n=1 Tax=Chitinophaga pinensis TaxID=79329 RepID=UPI0021BD14CA|nr:hypothetical protein [Chitinophaga pinensis]
MYATEHWSTLQSFACWELFKEQFVEPVYSQEKPYDLLFHQTLSILKETNGLSRQALCRGCTIMQYSTTLAQQKQTSCWIT